MKENNGFQKKRKSYICKLCYSELSSSAVLEKHIQNVHKNESHFLDREITEEELKYDCTVCEKSFVTENCLKLHEVKHDRTCFFCPLELKDNDDFEKHALEVHGKKDEPIGNEKYKCMLCENIILKSGMSHHRKTHSSKKYQCKLCYKEYNKVNLNQHIHNVHRSTEEIKFLKEGNKSDLKYDCTECELKFLTQTLLRTHERIHTPLAAARSYKEVPKLPVTCNLCYTIFASNSNLRQHQHNFHTTVEGKAMMSLEEIKPSLLKVDCQFCDKSFSTILAKDTTDIISKRIR